MGGLTADGPGGGRSTDSSSGRVRTGSAQFEEQLLEQLGGHALGLGLLGVGAAVPHAGGHEAETGPMECGLRRTELGDDVPAVGALVEEALDPSQLAFGAAQPIPGLLGDVLGEAHVVTVYP